MPRTVRFLLVVLVFWTPPAFAQDVPTLEVEFEEKLVLGDDEDAPTEYLFSAVRDVAVDEDGTIYVADHQSGEIRIFSPEGEHLRTLGRRGQGPGEFQDVSAMGVDGKGNVLVADRMNRRVTRFAKADGYQPQTYSLPVDGVPWVYGLHPMSGGKVALVYKSAQAGRSSEGGGQHTALLHIYDSSFSRVVDETAPYADFYDPDNPFHQALTQIPSAHFSVDAEDNILVVPRLYEGEIYFYEHADKRWAKHVWKGGYDPGYPAYELLDDSDYSSENRPFPYLSVNGPQGSFSAVLQKSSDGAFRLQDGRVIHFTRMGTEGKRVAGVEVFDEEGELIGYGRIDGYTETGENPLSLNVFTVDNDDRFYLTDTKNGFPVVRVVSLEYTVEE